MNLIDKVFHFTEEKRLFSTPCTVVLGLSGGADSMALLHMLCHWPQPGLTVTAVHVHHGIRGDEATADEQFVRKQCDVYGVPLHVIQQDVPTIAEQEHIGIEEAGRQVRYAAFAQVAERVRADRIATAHTASDQTETVLLHILRGCSVAGLRGIPPCRDAIIRPLLCCTRTEIEQYCHDNDISYVHDSTNIDVQYTRNAIRHQVLPLLRKLNPAADEALRRLSVAAQEDESYLACEAQKALQAAAIAPRLYTATPFAKLPPAISGRMVRLALIKVGCRSMEQCHMDMLRCILAEGHGRVELPGGFALTVRNNTLAVEGPISPTHPFPEPVPIISFPCSFVWDGKTVSLTVEKEIGINVHKKFFKYAIDCDKIQSSLQVRCRQPGDYMHPAGRQVGKSVKAIMNEVHLSHALRSRYPLLCDETGILLIPGLCCDERVCPDAHTKHFLVWHGIDEVS